MTTTSAPAPQRLRVGTDDLVVRAASALTGGALFAAEVLMQPGGGPPLMHRHDPSELYLILEGELAFYLADDDGTVRRSTATVGGVVPITGGRAHTIRNESRAAARAFVVYTPGAPLEAFVHAAAALAEDATPTVEDVVVLAERHGVVMTGAIPAVG